MAPGWGMGNRQMRLGNGLLKNFLVDKTSKLGESPKLGVQMSELPKLQNWLNLKLNP